MVYEVRDRLYLSAGAEQGRLTLSYFGHLQHLRLLVKLPDVVIPLNPVRPESYSLPYTLGRSVA